MFADDGGGPQDLHRAEGKDRRSGHSAGGVIQEVFPYLAFPYRVATAPFAVALIVMVV
jgi:hypothetical protein